MRGCGRSLRRFCRRTKAREEGAGLYRAKAIVKLLRLGKATGIGLLRLAAGGFRPWVGKSFLRQEECGCGEFKLDRIRIDHHTGQSSTFGIRRRINIGGNVRLER